jgi:uncharacterized SAM-dependent methyltransferase
MHRRLVTSHIRERIHSGALINDSSNYLHFYVLRLKRAPNVLLMSARIVDVRLNSNASNGEVNIRDEIINGLSRPAGQKILPQLLLYDDEGLRIFDEITTGVDDYYIFPAEENLLKNHANDIVRVMHGKEDQPMEGVVLELGAG